ncbi:hypothetical protein [Alkalithermobacter paradoxus]|uniref:Uncharacterized protein n=1 Tax=Alkalithermobacter paradoxus TaxID=29349 RepID=A0A1V4I7L6_9FIRM|nr:hypothetical protein CLOTH_13640 [[Clostridium] thermoalcaliphilum]
MLTLNSRFWRVFLVVAILVFTLERSYFTLAKTRYEQENYKEVESGYEYRKTN